MSLFIIQSFLQQNCKIIGLYNQLNGYPNPFNLLYPREYFEYERSNDPFMLIEKPISDRLFKKLFRIPKTGFKALFDIVNPYLNKPSGEICFGRPRIVNSTRLGIFLVFVGRDPNAFNVGWMFGVSESSVRNIVEEVTTAINLSMKSRMSLPNTLDRLQRLSDRFSAMTLFENCVGVLDGVHFPIKITEVGSYTTFYNHKGFYSLNAMCLVDSNCQFIYSSLGFPGNRHDSFCFDNSPINEWIKSLPKNFVVLGDGGFPLSDTLLIPNDKNELAFNPDGRRPYNYWLSKARVCTERCFGMLKARFHFLRTPVAIDKHQHIEITKACMLLHNFCCDIADYDMTIFDISYHDSRFINLCNEVSSCQDIFNEIGGSGDNFKRAYNNRVREQYSRFICEKQLSYRALD